MYKLIKNPFTNDIDVVLHVSNNTFIPMNEENSDYQEYLKWVAEGNTPLPAEE